MYIPSSFLPSPIHGVWNLGRIPTVESVAEIYSIIIVDKYNEGYISYIPQAIPGPSGPVPPPSLFFIKS